MAGKIDMMMDTAATSGAHVRNGAAQGLRDDVEQALAGGAGRADRRRGRAAGFYFYFWHALWVPKGTPKDVIAKLNDAVVKALQRSGDAQAALDIGQEFFPPEHEDAGGAWRSSRRKRSRSGGRSSRPPASRRSASIGE